MAAKFKAGHIYRLKDDLENGKVYGVSEDGIEVQYFDRMEEIKGYDIRVYQDLVTIFTETGNCAQKCVLI